jgi:hypothetical protein
VFGNDTGWGLLSGHSPDSFVVADLDGGERADIAIDFGAHGVWVYQNNVTWRMLHPSNPESLTVGRLH